MAHRLAVIADGHFNSGTSRCVIRLKKDRKVARLRQLLAQAQTNYSARVCGGQPDFLVFTFNAPRREKEFTADWWGANQTQLEIIADELPHWDSSVSNRPSKGIRFSSAVEQSANFAQYAFAAAKKPASFTESVRIRKGRGTEIEYCVHARAQDGLVGPGRKDNVYVAPNPEGFKYCFEVPTSFLLLRHNGYIFATGNTGKTFVAIKAAEKRIQQRQVRKVLVLAPKSLLRSVWAADCKKFAPALRVAVSTAGKHEAIFAQDADIYVTNIDAVKWLAKQPKKFFKDFDELIIDESSAYKHHTAQRSKAAAKIAAYFKFRRAMTGTPNSNTITDVWHQMKIIDGGYRLGGSFFAFRNAVCTPVQKGNHEKAIDWEDKEGAEETVFGMISDVVIRHKFEDCVDIPANHRYSVPYELTPNQQETYDKMEAMAITEIFGEQEYALAKLKGVRPKALAHVTAINQAAVRTKLLQIASGAVYESTEKYHLVDTGRYEMVLDLVEAREHSLTFFLWKHQRDLLLAEAEKRGIKFGLIDGTVNDARRDAIVKQYQAGMLQTIFAHPKSAAHGLTLTRGTATIWTSPTDDLEIFEQGSKRQHRMGQTKKTETISVIATNTVEEKVYNNMLSKGVRMKNLLDLFSIT